MPSKTSQSTLLQILVPLIALAIGLIWFLREEESTTVIAAPGDYLFCFWNVENLFDDKDNPKDLIADRQYDNWLSSNSADLNLKLQKHAEVLLALNGGKGPDILALVEVESPRAAELLMRTLNAKLDTAFQYQHILMKEVAAGRHIAPVVITRLPVVKNRTQQLGGSKTKRTLKTHLKAAGKELVVIVSHWRSRVEQNGDSGERQRAAYADGIYGVYKAMYLNNPKVDLLACGDFNDTPEDMSVITHLHATGDVNSLQQNPSHPMLFNLMAGKDPRAFGTHYYKGWHIFDQVTVSPGLLDNESWTCRTDTLQVLRRINSPNGDTISLSKNIGGHERPWRFGKHKEYGGNPAARGYSDHLPVVLMLSVKNEATEETPPAK